MADAPPAELLGSGPLPDGVVNELAERADILGVVFRGDGQPMWLGRKKRLATDAQFIATMARDGGCVPFVASLLTNRVVRWGSQRRVMG